MIDIAPYLIIYADVQDSRTAMYMVPGLDQYGWTMLTAMAMKTR